MPSVRRLLPLLLALVACSHVGEFVWVDAYREPPASKPSYVISPGDLVAVRVWNQEGMSARARVRPDGMISMPFLNDVEVAGVEPSALAQRLQSRLKDFIVNPVVTISLEESAPFEVSVIGEVSRAGVYKLDRQAGVLNAIAMAGGLTEGARRNRIFVLRQKDRAQQQVPLRIRFTYEALVHAQGLAATFRLRSGDIVVVE